MQASVRAGAAGGGGPAPGTGSCAIMGCMKRWIWPVLILLLSLSLGTAASGTDELEIGDTSDDLQRALIRLRDLGYASEPSHGELDGFEQRNLYDFLRENRLNTQGIPEELFSGEAVPAASLYKYWSCSLLSYHFSSRGASMAVAFISRLNIYTVKVTTKKPSTIPSRIRGIFTNFFIVRCSFSQYASSSGMCSSDGSSGSSRMTVRM